MKIPLLKATFLTIFFTIFAKLLCAQNFSNDKFVLIPEVQFESGKDLLRTDPFEIMTHPVTNLQYKSFIDAIGYAPPLHWQNGKIPAGKENHPVIYVNRYDIDAYLSWLNENSDLNYRLPTSVEFTVAASGGNMNLDYYWGGNGSKIDTNQINFDPFDQRSLTDWEKYLKPAQWGMKNNYGLYQMAGNVWQQVSNNVDPRDIDYTYRIESLVANERYMMGGGWTSMKEELRLGRTGGNSPGTRFPDLGFRLVRDPAKFKREIKYRQLAPVMHPSGAIAVSWAILNSDYKDIRFNIYRLTGNQRHHSGFKINKSPIASSSFLDTLKIVNDLRYQYRIAGVDKNGQETDISEWISITAGQYKYPVVVTYKPLAESGTLVPVFGDLEGWGRKGCVIKLENNNRAKQQDPGKPIQLEAFSSTGRSMWRKNIAWHESIYGNGTNAPFNVWDMDADDKAEVISRLQIGDTSYVAILNGMSGKVLYKTPWDEMATDVSRAGSRIHLSIAYLDGKTPSVITMTGIYENEIISAYDNKLNKLWQYNSFGATGGSGSHKIELADVNGDGKQEIIYGSVCLNGDGTVRWAAYRGHPDIVSIADHIPSRPGLEVCLIVEKLDPGIYMIDANTGENIWKSNKADDPLWSHGHYGWTSDIFADMTGIECVANRMGHGDRNYILFSSTGKRIMENFPSGSPCEWDGDQTREIFLQNGKVIANFNGKELIPIKDAIANPVPNSSVKLTADLFGDFRSEFVIQTKDENGRIVIMVLAAPEPTLKSFISPSDNLDYKLWLARNIGGGYGSIHNFELLGKESLKPKSNP